jgi:hypothetical protein
MKNYFRLIVYIICFVSIILIYHWWFTSWYIVWWDFQIRSEAFFTDFFTDFSLWINSLWWWFSATLNGYVNKYPIYIFSWMITSLWFSYLSFHKILFLFPIIIIGFLSWYKLFSYLSGEKTFSICLATLFVINPVLVEMLFRSHTWMTLVYSFIPLLIYFILRFLEFYNYKYVIYWSILVALFFAIEPRIWILWIILSIIVSFILNNKWIRFHKLWKGVFLWSLLSFLLMLYWLVPIIYDYFFIDTAIVSESISNSSIIINSSRNFWSMVNAMSNIPKWFSDWLLFWIVSFSILVFWLLLFKWDKRKLISLWIIWCVFAFLSKGWYWPFVDINIWLLNHNFFLSSYRNTNKFALVNYILFLIILLQLFSKLHFRSVLWIILVVLGIWQNVFIINGYINKFWIDDIDWFEKYNWERFTFIWQNIDHSLEYNKVFNEIDTDYSWTRTLWLPTIHDYRFTSNRSPYVTSWLKSLEKYFEWPNWQITNLFLSEEIDKIINDFSWLWISNIILKSPKEKEWWYVKMTYSEYKQAVSRISNETIYLENWGIRFKLNNKKVLDEFKNNYSSNQPYLKHFNNYYVKDNNNILLSTNYHDWWDMYLLPMWSDTYWSKLKLPFENYETKYNLNSWEFTNSELLSYLDRIDSDKLNNQYSDYYFNDNWEIKINLLVYFTPQKYFEISYLISSVTFLFLIFFISIDFYRNKKNLINEKNND